MKIAPSILSADFAALGEAVVSSLPGLGAHWQVDPPEGFPVALDAAGYLRLFPHVHGTDGFTAIRLRRAP